MNPLPCPKCNSVRVAVDRRGNEISIVCNDCGYEEFIRVGVNGVEVAKAKLVKMWNERKENQ